MKKIWMVVLAVVGVLVLAGVGTVGVVLAKDGGPVWLGFHPMMQDGGEDEECPLHDYKIAAFAEAVGLTPEALEARLENGETMYGIAIAQDIPMDQIPDVLRAARDKAIDAALADGVIDQAWADWMKSHGFGRGRYVPGYGMPYGNSGMHRGRNGYWQQNKP